MDKFAQTTLTLLPASVRKIQLIIEAQDEDAIQRLIKKNVTDAWPVYLPNKPLLKSYYENLAHLAIINDLLIYDDRIVIPTTMRLEMLDIVHSGHWESPSARLEHSLQSGGLDFLQALKIW